MTDIELFEPGFGSLLRQYAAAGAPAVKQQTLDAAVEAGVRQRQGRRLWPSPALGRFPGMAVAAAVVVLAVALAFGVWVGGGSMGPGASPSPSPTPHPTFGPTAAGGGWPVTMRPEPVGGAPDVELLQAADGRFQLNDPAGDVRADSVDMTMLLLNPLAPGPNGAAMRIRLVEGVPDGLDPTEQWIAMGVVIDADRDGIGDFQIGMDNARGANHREWATNLRTRVTDVNQGTTYGYFAFDMFFDTYYRSAFDDPDPLIIFRPPGNEPGVRFYAWASLIDGGEPTTDFAPDEGWIEYVPVEDEVQQ